MPAGKSPNNAFILHKERMKDVFITVQVMNASEAWNSYLSQRRIEALKPLETRLSTRSFYWVNFCGNIRCLFSKGYIDKNGEWTQQETEICDRTLSLSIIKIRTYYTDGVRAIGALE